MQDCKLVGSNTQQGEKAQVLSIETTGLLNGRTGIRRRQSDVTSAGSDKRVHHMTGEQIGFPICPYLKQEFASKEKHQNVCSSCSELRLNRVAFCSGTEQGNQKTGRTSRFPSHGLSHHLPPCKDPKTPIK